MTGKIVIRETPSESIGSESLFEGVRKSLEGRKLKKVLLIPPDYTRYYSMAGDITNMYYQLLQGCSQVDILPALGTHEPMTEEECLDMFGEIPFNRFIVHDWKSDVVKIGTVPSGFVKEVSEGLIEEAIDVELNRLILDKSYDLIVSIGQVVPHEVVGMANYSKNIFVGCGGHSMINKSHMLGAFYGMERIMGKDHSPVRKVFDYAHEEYLKDIPLLFVLTVTTVKKGKNLLHGVYFGNERSIFEEAVAQSQQLNLNYLEKAPKKMVVYLDEKEYKSTWLGNKAVYRTRMAIADGGELIVLAPSVSKFGEDRENDRLIRKYGYLGREEILDRIKENEDLRDNLSVAAHLIHGSSDGRFSVTYAVRNLTEEEIQGVHYKYADYEETIKRYDPAKLVEGTNMMEDGEEIYYISNPGLGLWAERKRFL
ncbi:MAG: lactate racemase domain-containing protein [Clostridia bacterium]